MTRPTTSAAHRLRNRVWAFGLVGMAQQAEQEGRLCPFGPNKGEPFRSSLLWIERQLAEVRDTSGALIRKPDKTERFQALGEVLRNGRDPRLAVRRFKKGDFTLEEEAPGIRKFEREDSQDGKVHIHYEIAIDLVARAELLLPGSRDWYDAKLWDFASKPPGSLESVRTIVFDLLEKIGYFRPTFYHRTSNREILPLPIEEPSLLSIYEERLKPIIALGTAHAISLLAAMTVEAYLAEPRMLFPVHGMALRSAIKELTKKSSMQRVREPLLSLIEDKICDMNWPDATHPPGIGIEFPLYSLEEWKALGGSDPHWLSANPFPLGERFRGPNIQLSEICEIEEDPRLVAFRAHIQQIKDRSSS